MARFKVDFAPRALLQPSPHPLPPMLPQTVFTGTTGNDVFTGGGGGDTFNMANGGDDRVKGKAGSDIFNFGAGLTAADRVDGGADGDTLNLAGNYSGANAVVFGAVTVINVETLTLSGGKFDLTTNDATVALGQTLTVDATALAGTQSLTFNGSAETNGAYNFMAGTGAAFLTGGAGNDGFTFGANFKASNRIDGGGSGDFDFLSLNGDYSAGLAFEGATIRNIEEIRFAAGHSYFITMDNANQLLGQGLSITASSLGAADKLTFDGSDESSASFFIVSGAGNDVLLGGGGFDEIETGAGNDTVFGGDGGDVIRVDNNFTAADFFDGGTGDDALIVTGGASVVFGAATVRGIETIGVQSGNYAFTLNAQTVAFGQALTIDGRSLGSGNSLAVNAAAIVDGRLLFLGGAGIDTFTLGQSGLDVARMGDGDDLVLAFGSLQETDRIDGGASVDDGIELDGDYSDRFQFQSHTIRNIEHLDLVAGHDYNLALSDGNVAAGGFLDVNGSSLGVSDKLIFDASAESNAGITIRGGDASDVLIGGAGNDTLQTGGGSGNVIDATRGGGDTIIVDTAAFGTRIFFGAELTGSDTVIHTGGNILTMFLDGDYAKFGASHTLPAIDGAVVEVAAGHSYILEVDVTGISMTVTGFDLFSENELTFVASGAGSIELTGGLGDDELTGADGNDEISGRAGDDLIAGGFGADRLLPGDGKDIFQYGAAGHSTSINYDTIVAASFSQDVFDTSVNITGVDTAVTTGALSDTNAGVFDGQLTSALAGHLNALHAIIFSPNSGTLDNHKFLIIDQNNALGYQAGVDIVIDVTGAVGTLDPADFT